MKKLIRKQKANNKMWIFCKMIELALFSMENSYCYKISCLGCLMYILQCQYVFCKARPTLTSLRARKKGNKFHGTCIMLASLLSGTSCKPIDNHSMEVAKTSVSAGNTV